MNKIYKLFLILVIGILFTSCTKKDATEITPPREYDVQYAADLATIEKYLDEYYMEVSPDLDVTFTKIPSPNPDGKVSIRLQTEYPLQDILVQNDDHDVEYKVYYLNLRTGVNESPTAVDSVYVSYKGNYIYHRSDEVLPSTDPKVYVDNIYDKQFDAAPNPTWFQLEAVIPGWSEIITLFKTGNYNTSGLESDPASFTDFGAGVMFLPSGLGYFNAIPSATLPQYSPLIFSFKLDKQRHRDHDRDGIWSKNEINPVLAESQDPKDYDSDADGYANMFDLDDDADYYLTRNEIMIGGVVPTNYNDILNCAGTTGGVKKHLDPTCH